MKKSIVIFIVMLSITFCTYAYADGTYPSGSIANSTSANQINSSQNQTVFSQGFGQGGNANSDSDSVAISGDSGAIANISTNSTSNYETRTPPVSMFPPYLPTFSHGGWGTIQAYFPNGPTTYDQIYEQAFYPGNDKDIKELKGVLTSLSYEGPLSFVGGILNGIGTLFGGPDNFHHGRGFEIASSLTRERRPNNKPLIILIDSQINRDYLTDNGFAYAGKVSLEGKIERNWDLVYKAAIAEVLPWNVDIMLVSGGMKGVTVGTNTTFPGITGAYSQTNYSVSMIGGRATGITEGKGMAMVSAECYRYNPRAADRRMIPSEFYKQIHTNSVASTTNLEQVQTPVQNQTQKTSARVSFQSETNVKAPEKIQTTSERVSLPAQTPVQAASNPKPKSTLGSVPQTSVQPQKQPILGVKVSQELYEMAGFVN